MRLKFETGPYHNKCQSIDRVGGVKAGQTISDFKTSTCSWGRMEPPGDLWPLWGLMGAHGTPWGFHGTPWAPIGPREMGPIGPMLLHGTPWGTMGFHAWVGTRGDPIWGVYYVLLLYVPKLGPHPRRSEVG